LDHDQPKNVNWIRLVICHLTFYFKVWRSAINGTGVEKILTGLNTPGNIAIIQYGKQSTIWIAEGDGIYAANLDGSNYQLIQATSHSPIQNPKLAYNFQNNAVYYAVGHDMYMIPSVVPPFSSIFLYSAVVGFPVVPISGLDLDPVFQTVYYAIQSVAGLASTPTAIMLSAHLEDGQGAQNIAYIQGGVVADICFNWETHQLYIIQSNSTLPMIWQTDAFGTFLNPVTGSPSGIGAGGINCDFGYPNTLLYFLADSMSNPTLCSVNMIDSGTGELTHIICDLDLNGEVPVSLDVEYLY